MKQLNEDDYIAPVFLLGVFLISLAYFMIMAAI
jgi:hypothetical protein